MGRRTECVEVASAELVQNRVGADPSCEHNTAVERGTDGDIGDDKLAAGAINGECRPGGKVGAIVAVNTSLPLGP